MAPAICPITRSFLAVVTKPSFESMASLKKPRTFNAFIVNEGPALWRSCLESPGELNQNHGRIHMNPLWKRYTYNFHVAKGSRISWGIYLQFVFVSALSSADWTLLSLNYLCKEKARSVQTGIEPFITSTSWPSWALVLSGRLKLIPNTIGFPLTVNYAACERVLGRATQVVLQQGYCVLQTCQTPCSLLFANMLFGFLLVRS